MLNSVNNLFSVNNPPFVKGGFLVEYNNVENIKLKHMRESHKKNSKKYWSDKITKYSNALDLEKGVFTFKSPREIALSLKESAKQSERRKAEPFQSAMSMLNFYINRAGKNLSKNQKKILEQAKIELRKIFKK